MPRGEGREGFTRWLDPWLRAGSQPLVELVEHVTGRVAEWEKSTGQRQRARKPVDEARHRLAVEALTVNLALAVLEPPPEGGIAYHRKTGKTRALSRRYDHAGYPGDTFGHAIGALEAIGLLEEQGGSIRRGREPGVAPSLWPRGPFRELMAGRSIRRTSIVSAEDEEVILLWEKDRRDLGQGADGFREAEVERTAVEYADTEQTTAIRRQLRRLNAFLAEADLAFVDDGAGRVDTGARRLYRHFSMLDPNGAPRFDQGGRLYGGFWQGMRKSRRPGIRIGGEPVVTLDYSSMAVRLAYAQAGAAPPPSDLYAVPGLEGYRADVKTLMSCLWFDRGQRRQWPEDMLRAACKLDEAGTPRGRADPDASPSPEGSLPRDMGVGEAKRLILAHHPALKPLVGIRAGFGFFMRESEVLLAVLEELMGRSIVALPIHDAVVVPALMADEAQTIMSRKALEVAGVPIPVKREVG